MTEPASNQASAAQPNEPNIPLAGTALGPAARPQGWLSRNRRILVTGMLAVLSFGGAAALTANWHSVSMLATWGQPLTTQSFTDPSWSLDWMNANDGGWRRVDNRIVSTGEYASYLVYRKRLVPPLALEYTARMDPGAKPGDLSVWWCEGDPLGVDARIVPHDLPGWFIQAGAYENSTCSLFRAPGNIRASNANLHLAPGVDHRFRVELDHDRLRFWVDGKLMIDHRDLFPIRSGYLGLYGYFAGKSFTDISLWQPEVPDLISPLALGEADYQEGRFTAAAATYERIASSRPRTAMANDALFRASLAYRQAGEPLLAEQVRERIKDPALRQRAQILEVDDLAKHGDIAGAAARLTTFWKERPQLHEDLRQRWQEVARMLQEQPTGKPAKNLIESKDLRAWYDLREQLFPTDEASAWLAARILLNQESYAELVQRFPLERRVVSYALIALGRTRELVAADWASSGERILAHLAIGDLQVALASPDMHRDMRALVLCDLGRFEEALAIAPYPALVHLGRTDELLATKGLFPGRANAALVAAGRLEQAAGDGIPGMAGTGHDAAAMVLLGRLDEAASAGFDVSYHRLFAALGSGDVVQARALRPTVLSKLNGLAPQRWFGPTIGLALADVQLGDPQALRMALEHGKATDGSWGGRYAAVANAALADRASPVELTMEWTVEKPAWTAVASALRAELAGDQPGALAAWQTFVALPLTQRLLENSWPQLELETCVQSRIAALQRGSR